LRAVRRIFWGEGPSQEFHDLRDARGTELGALVILGGAIIVFGCWPRLVLDFIDRATLDYVPHRVASHVQSTNQTEPGRLALTENRLLGTRGPQ
jgi:NADH:ubiquinone oxidoreductase subunit 4 (subunit M)